MRYREVERVLRNNGWILVRINGSHHLFKHPHINYLAVVPNHGSADVSLGVLRSLQKGTGLSFLR